MVAPPHRHAPRALQANPPANEKATPSHSTTARSLLLRDAEDGWPPLHIFAVEVANGMSEKEVSWDGWQSAFPLFPLAPSEAAVDVARDVVGEAVEVVELPCPKS